MTSYEMRSSDWSSAVCASDRLLSFFACGRRGAWVAWAVDDPKRGPFELHTPVDAKRYPHLTAARVPLSKQDVDVFYRHFSKEAFWPMLHTFWERARFREDRSEEHTSELQSLMRISYAVFCLKKKKQ